MTDTSTPILAMALDATALDAGLAAGRLDPAPWLEFTLAAERAGLSFVTLADSHRAESGVPRLDAILLAAYLAARTTRVGVIAEADTTVSEPYLLATQIATVDFAGHGRAGWLAQVTGAPEDAGYVGPREVSTGADAWAEAGEYVEVVRALWDSWEDGAEIRDITTQRFIDRDRIHHINFEGEHLTIAGPSISPRPPQGQPPVAVSVASGVAGRLSLALAVSQADIVFLRPGADPEALRRGAADHGREVRLLADLAVAEASAAAVVSLIADGYDGVRLIPASLPVDLAAMTALADELIPGGGAARVPTGADGEPPTLRETLGLPRPANRYSLASTECA